MKRVLLVLVAVLLCGLPVLAQEYPKSELFLGYQYLHFSPALGGNDNVNMSGGGGSIAYNFSPMFGLKAEFTGVGGGDQKICASAGLNCATQSANLFTYMFGPQITFRKNPHWQPFTELMFGGAYSNYYAHVSTPGVVVNGQTVSDTGKNAFALAVGGGLDVKVSKSVAIRLAQLDYVMTRFSGREVYTAGTGSIGSKSISNQSNFRYMAGINFHLGNTQ